MLTEFGCGTLDVLKLYRPQSTLDREELKLWFAGLCRLDLSLAVFVSTFFLFVFCNGFVNLSRRKLKEVNKLI